MTVGVYAENLDTELSRKVHSDILDIIKNYEYVLQIHWFYLDENKKIINYDLVISFDDDNPEDTIEKIRLENEKLYPDYKIYINFDQDFSLS